jgi:hypothetical protein
MKESSSDLLRKSKMRKANSITQAHLQRLLLLALCLSAMLLLSALLVALRTVHQIERNTQTFADRQSLAKDAIDGIEKQQADLNARWLQLARKKDLVRRGDAGECRAPILT